MIMSALSANSSEQDVRDGDLGALQPEIDLQRFLLSATGVTSEGPDDDDLIDRLIHPDGDPNGGIWVLHRNNINA